WGPTMYHETHEKHENRNDAACGFAPAHRLREREATSKFSSFLFRVIRVFRGFFLRTECGLQPCTEKHENKDDAACGFAPAHRLANAQRQASFSFFFSFSCHSCVSWFFSSN